MSGITKEKEKEEYFRIRDKYFKDGKRDFASIEKYFKDSKFDNITNQTLRNWESKPIVDNGEFDIQVAFLQNAPLIWNSFMDAVKKGNISPQVFRTFAQLAQQLTEKREDTLKVEFTPTDRIRIARDLRDNLRREFKESGSCPLCHQSALLRNEICVGTESEQPEDREVAALALPARPD